jgi:hypothetical protein
MSCASCIISREMEGWSSMRFCSMKGQNSIDKLKMKFIFRNEKLPRDSKSEVEIDDSAALLYE